MYWWLIILFLFGAFFNREACEIMKIFFFQTGYKFHLYESGIQYIFVVSQGIGGAHAVCVCVCVWSML